MIGRYLTYLSSVRRYSPRTVEIYRGVLEAYFSFVSSDMSDSKGSARQNFASLIPPTAPQRVPPVHEATGGHGSAGQTLADASLSGGIQPVVREVQTFYEQLFLEQGYPITYLAFVIDHEGPYVSPKDPEEFDTKAWRAAEGPRLLFGHDSAETRRQKLHDRAKGEELVKKTEE